MTRWWSRFRPSHRYLPHLRPINDPFLQCLDVKDIKVITATVQRMPPHLVPSLLTLCISRIQARPSRAVQVRTAALAITAPLHRNPLLLAAVCVDSLHTRGACGAAGLHA
jgi:hypothetical protein